MQVPYTVVSYGLVWFGLVPDRFMFSASSQFRFSLKSRRERVAVGREYERYPAAASWRSVDNNSITAGNHFRRRENCRKAHQGSDNWSRTKELRVQRVGDAVQHVRFSANLKPDSSSSDSTQQAKTSMTLSSACIFQSHELRRKPNKHLSYLHRHRLRRHEHARRVRELEGVRGGAHEEEPVRDELLAEGRLDGVEAREHRASVRPGLGALSMHA